MKRVLETVTGNPGRAKKLTRRSSSEEYGGFADR